MDLQLCSQSVSLPSKQTVNNNVVLTDPEFAIQISESPLVTEPAAPEIHSAASTPLNHL